MKKNIRLILAGLMVMLFSGCETTGLSLRESGNFNYSNFIYGLYGKDSTPVKEVKSVRKPMKLAVAQVGETAPPKIVLDKLNSHKELVSMTSILPAGGNAPNYYNNDKSLNTKDFEERMVKMRQLAKDLGAEYLFLFGGTSDTGEQQSWLGVMDITIIGAFIIPTHKIVSEGKASGALIDVETGKVILMVSSQDSKTIYATSANLQGKYNQVLVSLRDTLVDSLTDQLITKLGN